MTGRPECGDEEREGSSLAASSRMVLLEVEGCGSRRCIKLVKKPESRFVALCCCSYVRKPACVIRRASTTYLCGGWTMSVPSIASIVRYGLRGRPAFNGSVLRGLANGRGLGCAHGRILNGAGRRWSGRHSSSWWRDGGVWHAAYAVGVGRVSANSRVRIRLPNIGGLVGLVLYDLDGVLDNVLSGGH